MEQQTSPRYLTELEVGRITGLALATLRNHRYLGKGIPYVKFGRSIRYLLDDVIQYANERRVVPANEGAMVEPAA